MQLGIERLAAFLDEKRRIILLYFFIRYPQQLQYINGMSKRFSKETPILGEGIPAVADEKSGPSPSSNSWGRTGDIPTKVELLSLSELIP
jgi:hypothetical protein